VVNGQYINLLLILICHIAALVRRALVEVYTVPVLLVVNFSISVGRLYSTEMMQIMPFRKSLVSSS